MTTTTDDRTVTLVFRERPPSANRHRSQSRWLTMAETKHWRQLGRLAMREQIIAGRIPVKVQSISVEARQLATDGRWHMDVGGVFPAVKAAIDGIADTGLISNDTARHHTKLTFEPCKIAGFDGLQIDVTWWPLTPKSGSPATRRPERRDRR